MAWKKYPRIEKQLSQAPLDPPFYDQKNTISDGTGGAGDHH